MRESFQKLQTSGGDRIYKLTYLQASETGGATSSKKRSAHWGMSLQYVQVNKLRVIVSAPKPQALLLFNLSARRNMSGFHPFQISALRKPGAFRPASTLALS